MLNDKRCALAIYRMERAKELIDDAKQLYKSGSYKSSNNRAYYAIFHTMRAVLALEEVDFKKHSGVIQYFQREYIKTGIFEKAYSDIIISASEIRNASDYDDFFLASKEETKEQIDNAELFCKAIEEYLNSTVTHTT
ncbi:MAG: HEPN domain-containing protein [Anaerovoracaceae bacterium]|nr:HEPN domain-containing protein [Anaerovoracaceae bacterium]